MVKAIFLHFQSQGFNVTNEAYKVIALHQYMATLTTDKRDWVGMNQPSTEYVIYSHYSVHLDRLPSSFINCIGVRTNLPTDIYDLIVPSAVNVFEFDIMITT